MKLEVLQENLTHGLGVVSRIISSRPTLPILSHVLLSARNNKFTLTTSNSETTIVLPLGAKIEEEGDFTVPVRTLQDLVATLSPGKISLSLTSSQLKIVSSNFSGKINGTPASEFPPVTPVGSDKSFWEIDGPLLLAAVNKTLFSAATDQSRAVLTGVLFKPEENGLILASTDGFRLSRFDLGKTSAVLSSQNSVILPSKTLSELSKLLSEKGSEAKSKIRINFLDNNQVLFVVGDINIYSSLVSGNFPDFEKIIPSESLVQVIVSSEELSKAVRLASVFARESANIVKLTIKNTSLIISANAAEVGENETEIDVEVKNLSAGRQGEVGELQIAFNYRYILDFLTSLGKDSKITIDFTTSLAPGVFRADKDKNFLHLIMPVRVQS